MFGTSARPGRWWLRCCFSDGLISTNLLHREHVGFIVEEEFEPIMTTIQENSIYERSRDVGPGEKSKNLMESRGLQKVAGCCWIEVKRKVYSLASVDELNPQIEQIHALVHKLSMEMKEKGYMPNTKLVLYDLESKEKERIILGHSEKLAVAFGLINTSKGDTIRITKNLRLCEDCHSFTKIISKFADRELFVRDINRIHHFKDGSCSCADYW